MYVHIPRVQMYIYVAIANSIAGVCAGTEYTKGDCIKSSGFEIKMLATVCSVYRYQK